MKKINQQTYTKEEIVALKTMVKSGTTYAVIAKILKRGKSSVASKASKLNITNFRKYENLDNNKELFDYGKLDSKIKGTIAEQLVAIKLLEQHFKVYFPFVNNQEEDLIISKNNKYFKIQVKSASKTDGNRFRVSIVRKRSVGINKGTRVRYKDIDFFIVFIPVFKLFYVIPESVTKSVKELNFYPSKIKTMIRDDINDWDSYLNKFDLIK